MKALLQLLKERTEEKIEIWQAGGRKMTAAEEEAVKAGRALIKLIDSF